MSQRDGVTLTTFCRRIDASIAVVYQVVGYYVTIRKYHKVGLHIN